MYNVSFGSFYSNSFFIFILARKRTHNRCTLTRDLTSPKSKQGSRKTPTKNSPVVNKTNESNEQTASSTKKEPVEPSEMCGEEGEMESEPETTNKSEEKESDSVEEMKVKKSPESKTTSQTKDIGNR